MKNPLDHRQWRRHRTINCWGRKMYWNRFRKLKDFFDNKSNNWRRMHGKPLIRVPLNERKRKI